jgi:hypothetical protein
VASMHFDLHNALFFPLHSIFPVQKIRALIPMRYSTTIIEVSGGIGSIGLGVGILFLAWMRQGWEENNRLRLQSITTRYLTGERSWIWRWQT